MFPYRAKGTLQMWLRKALEVDRVSDTIQVGSMSSRGPHEKETEGSESEKALW
jgi:hypothetical protein